VRLAVGAAALVAVAAVAYLYGLGHAFIPSIGDEPLYLQIARRTLESGRLLPLLSDSGITDTKPPLLFWQGMAAARLAGPGLLWLRLPDVLLTLGTAALAGWLAARLSGRRFIGLLAAVVFLGFRSTVQHGRPFLTNAGETFFLFLPLALAWGRPRLGAGVALACGASLGAAALYKSFAVILPGVLGLALVLRHQSGLAAGPFLRRHGTFLALSATAGLAIFGVWLLLDPRPDLVLAQFVLQENAGKLQPGGWLAGLLSGPYPLWRLWLGPLANAGLLAPVVAGLLADLWRRRHALPAAEAQLWLYLLAFLLFYSLPAQRQANYLLPAMAALAVLLALRWEAIGPAWFRLALVPLALAAALLPVLEARVERAAGAPLWGVGAWALPLALAALAAAGAVRAGLGRALLPALALLAVVAVTGFLAPFSRPLPAAVAAELGGRPVPFPERFQRESELYRFLAPGADVRGYPCPPAPAACPVPAGLAPGAYVATYASTVRAPPGFTLVAELPHLRSRHSAAEVRAMAKGDLGPLLEHLLLLRVTPPGA